MTQLKEKTTSSAPAEAAERTPRKPLSTEAERATRFARSTVMAAAAALFGSVMVDAFHQAVAVPSLPAGVFQQATYVEFRDVPPPEETPPEEAEAPAPLPPEEVL